MSATGQVGNATPAEGRLAAKTLGRKVITRVCSCRIFMLLLGLGGVFAGLLLLAAFDPTRAPGGLRAVLAIAGLAGVGLLALVAWVAWDDLVQPMIQMHEWTQRIRAGSLSTRLAIEPHTQFGELAEDLNSIGEMLENQSRDTERQIRLHLEHITQKTHSLQALYDVAASINVSRDLNDLLGRFLHNLKDIVGARAAAVRLRGADGKLRLVASIGLDDAIVAREQVVPAASCLCSQAAECDQVLTLEDASSCSEHLGRKLFGEDPITVLAVPLQYRDRTLGVYNLFVDRDGFSQREDTQDLLTSIGRHLGMAIEKARLDEEAHLLGIMEERTRLAHELHDSLAQTLASLRFQVRVLDETLHQDDDAATWNELERIENTLDEANTELRELIAHFRAPIGERGLLPAVEQAVKRFRQESRIPIFLQKEWPIMAALPAELEMQVLRIIQEALANIRKHSQAHAVRVLMQGSPEGRYRVLVEDDGVGLGARATEGAPGEHLGLSILHDRARRIGGELRLESEPGEGTRVILTFQHPRGAVAAETELENEITRAGHR